MITFNPLEISRSKNFYIYILVLIILIGIFFRFYKAFEKFDYAHDGDLYSWIVKDIVVDKHPRLIGQETSTEGIYIGPLFYYALIPFFLLTSLDPIGGVFFATLLSLITILSYYYIFKKLFNIQTGLIAAFLQSILFSRVSVDRWLVPTITSSLWEVWFFYVILMLTRGNLSVFPILGLLVGLIWHINFSLAPIFLTIPLALFFAKKMPNIKDIIKALIAALIPLTPLIIFEFKHNFVQTKGFINSFLINQGGGSGLDKLNHVMQEVSGNLVSLFFYPKRDLMISNILFFIILLMIGIFTIKKDGFSKSMYVILIVWVFSIITFFTFSSKIISEYYFSSLNTVFLGIVIVGISLLLQNLKKIGFKKIRWLIFGILLTLLFNNFFILLTSNYNQMGYVERKAMVEFIKNDAERKKFPCVAISYITTPGNNVGFRYFFYLKSLHVNQPSSGSPVYTIVIPANLYNIGADQTFGSIGVIVPKDIPSAKQIGYSCSGEDSNLTDPLFGFTKN